MDTDIVLKYFPSLTPRQREQLGVMMHLYPEWNERINVVSRRDIDNLAEHHILHSLAIGRFLMPRDGARVMDLGCGGGFPGIPLAMLWPECRFLLVDRVGKKLTVARAVAEAMGLENVRFYHGDSGEVHEKFDYVVSRAVMPLPDLVKACRKNIERGERGNLRNGLLCLKGGDLDEEVRRTPFRAVRIPLSDMYSEEHFRQKELIYITL